MFSKIHKRSRVTRVINRGISTRLEILPTQDQGVLNEASNLVAKYNLDGISVVCKSNTETFECVSALSKLLPASAIKPHINLTELGEGREVKLVDLAKRYQEMNVMQCMLVRGDNNYVNAKADLNLQQTGGGRLYPSIHYLRMVQKYLHTSLTCHPQGHMLNPYDAVLDAKFKLYKGAHELVSQVAYEKDSVQKFTSSLGKSAHDKLRISIMLSAKVNKFVSENNILFPDNAREAFENGNMVLYLTTLVRDLEGIGCKKITIASLNKLELADELLASIQKPAASIQKA